MTGEYGLERGINNIIDDIRRNTDTIQKLEAGFKECVEENLEVYRFHLLVTIMISEIIKSEKILEELESKTDELIAKRPLDPADKTLIDCSIFFLKQNLSAKESAMRTLKDIVPMDSLF